MKTILFTFSLILFFCVGAQPYPAYINAWGDSRSGKYTHTTANESATQAESIVGAQPFISILCKFARDSYQPNKLAYFKRMYSASFPGLSHYWKELSYGKANLSGSDAVGWYTMPHDLDYYIATSDYLYYIAQDCTSAAAKDVDFNRFSGVNLMLNDDIDSSAYGGTNYIKLSGTLKYWRMTWLPPWAFSDLVVVSHEMGHAFGLPHSLGLHHTDYGNQYDVMSDMWSGCERATVRVYGCLGQSTIAYHKYLLGWLDGRVYTPSRKRSTVTIGRLELPARRGWLMARIPINGSLTHFYTIETRAQSGYDKKLPGMALVIHEVTESIAPSNMDTPAVLVKVLVTGSWSKNGVTITIFSKTASSYTLSVKIR